MEKKIYIAPKPSIEEVALDALFDSLWDVLFKLNEVNNFKVIHCGIVDVNLYNTPGGVLFQLIPVSPDPYCNGYKNECAPMYLVKLDRLLKTEGSISELHSPSGFAEWFINSIDRMYGWDTENTDTNDTGKERRNTIVGRPAMG